MLLDLLDDPLFLSVEPLVDFVLVGVGVAGCFPVGFDLHFWLPLGVHDPLPVFLPLPEPDRPPDFPDFLVGVGVAVDVAGGLQGFLVAVGVGLGLVAVGRGAEVGIAVAVGAGVDVGAGAFVGLGVGVGAGVEVGSSVGVGGGVGNAVGVAAAAVDRGTDGGPVGVALACSRPTVACVAERAPGTAPEALAARDTMPTSTRIAVRTHRPVRVTN